MHILRKNFNKKKNKILKNTSFNSMENLAIFSDILKFSQSYVIKSWHVKTGNRCSLLTMTIYRTVIKLLK